MRYELSFALRYASAFFIVFALGWTLYTLAPLLLALLVSFYVAMVFEPLIELALKKGIARIWTVLFLLVSFVASVSSIGIASISPLISEGEHIASQSGVILQNLAFGNKEIATALETNLHAQYDQYVSSALNASVGIFGNVLFIISMIVFTTYLMLFFDSVQSHVIALIPTKHRNKTRNILKEIEIQLGRYLRGQLFLGCVIGVATFIGLSLLNVNYALTLAIIAGILELVPFFGPVISVFPAIFVTIGYSSWQTAGVIFLYILIQQLENHLLVPKITQNSIGFNPLITLLVLMFGGALLGPIGVILAIPTTLILKIIFKDAIKAYIQS